MDKDLLKQLSETLKIDPAEVEKLNFKIIKSDKGEVLGAIATNNKEAWLVNLSNDKKLVLNNAEIQNSQGVDVTLGNVSFQDRSGNEVKLDQASRKVLNVEKSNSGNNSIAFELPNRTDGQPSTEQTIHIASTKNKTDAFLITPVVGGEQSTGDGKFNIKVHGELELSTKTIDRQLLTQAGQRTTDTPVIIIAEKDANLKFTGDKYFTNNMSYFLDDNKKFAGVGEDRNNIYVSAGAGNLVLASHNGTTSATLNADAKNEEIVDKLQKDSKTRDAKILEGKIDYADKLAAAEPSLNKLEKLLKATGGKFTDKEQDAFEYVKDQFGKFGDAIKYDPNFNKKINELFANTGNNIESIKKTILE